MQEKPRDKTLLHVFILSIIWISLIFIINPVGNFPLNDDWAYATTVKSLVEEGRLIISDWISPTFIAQALWGSFFCYIFGFSFTVLRFSTITLGLAGVIATYLLFRECKYIPIALPCTLLIMLNPVYFNLSNTFMTDIPFYSFGILAILFYVRSIKVPDNIIEIIIGTFFSTLAILTRQIALIIPIAFAISYVSKTGLKRKSVLNSTIIVILTSGVYFLYVKLMEASGKLSLDFNKSKSLNQLFSSDFSFILQTVIERAFHSLLYLGLFLLPVLLFVYPHVMKPHYLKKRGASIFRLSAVFLTVLFGLLYEGKLMPLEGNIIYNFGLGTQKLYISMSYIMSNPALSFPDYAPKSFWLVVTIASVLGAVLLIDILLMSLLEFISQGKKEHLREHSHYRLFVGIICLVYSALPLLVDLLDRYFIQVMPLLFILLPVSLSIPKISLKKPLVVISMIIMLSYAFFSVTLTHDYLSWNRARWRALNYLTNELKVSHKDINGGFEFNGWYGYRNDYQKRPGKSWWWVDNDAYVISRVNNPGFTLTKRYPYQRWLPYEKGYIYLQKR